MIEIEAITQLSHSVDGERMSGFVTNTAAAAGFGSFAYVRQYRSRIQSHAKPRPGIRLRSDASIALTTRTFKIFQSSRLLLLLSNSHCILLRLTGLDQDQLSQIL